MLRMLAFFSVLQKNKRFSKNEQVLYNKKYCIEDEVNDKLIHVVNICFWHLKKNIECNEQEIRHTAPLILTKVNSCLTMSILSLLFGILDPRDLT